MGAKFVHLKYLFDDKYLRGLRHNQTTPSPGAFRHIVCRNRHSEDDFYQDYNTKKFQCSAERNPRQFQIETFSNRHHACMKLDSMWEKLFNQSDKDRKGLRPDALDLNVLKVCRQLYIEGSETLWRTNTWSFDDAYTLHVFLSGLSPLARHHITKVHFSIIWHWTQLRAWGHALRILPLAHGFPHLWKLTISIDTAESLRCDASSRIKGFLREGFREVGRLPLREVKVFLNSPTLGSVRKVPIHRSQMIDLDVLHRPRPMAGNLVHLMPYLPKPCCQLLPDKMSNVHVRKMFNEAQEARMSFCKTFEKKIRAYVRHDRMGFVRDEQKRLQRDSRRDERWRWKMSEGGFREDEEDILGSLAAGLLGA